MSSPAATLPLSPPPPGMGRQSSVGAGLRLLPSLGIVLLLPTLFAGFLAFSAWWLSHQIDQAIEDLTLGRGPAWWAGSRLVLLGLGVVNWIMLFKPLLARSPRRPSERQMREAGHPEFFRLLKSVLEWTGGRGPVEVWINTSPGVAMEIRGGLWGWCRQRLVLTVGAPWVSGVTVRELAGALAAQAGRNPKGLEGLLLQVFRGVNAWLDWAVCRRNAWEDALTKGRDQPSKRKSMLGKLWRGFVWLTQRPVWVFMEVARLASAGAMRRMVFNADACEALVAGQPAFEQSLAQASRFDRVWAELVRKVQEGVKAERLPDNLPLLSARFLRAQTGQGGMAPAAEAGGLFMPSHRLRLEQVRKLGLRGQVQQGDAPASSLFRDFTDLSRQLTQFHYQQDLGLDIVQFRIVAAEEALQQAPKAEENLPGLQRYFRGMAHPDRALCGLVPEGVVQPAPEAMMEEIRSCQEWMAASGDQVKMLLKEWGMGWQRCRDLEMAHALALAEMPVDSHQYGVRAHDAALYREEYDQQALALSYTEDSLVMMERRLESRLTCALGLLCAVETTALPEELAGLQRALPARAVVYGALAGQICCVRQLKTLFNAFQALGVAHAGVESPGLHAALRHLAPQLAELAARTLQPLFGVGLELNPGIPTPCAATQLAGMPLQDAWRLIQADWTQLGYYSHLGAPAAAQLGGLVEHLLDSFQEAYRRSFDWLARAAELSEDYFIHRRAFAAGAG